MDIYPMSTSILGINDILTMLLSEDCVAICSTKLCTSFSAGDPFKWGKSSKSLLEVSSGNLYQNEQKCQNKGQLMIVTKKNKSHLPLKKIKLGKYSQSSRFVWTVPSKQVIVIMKLTYIMMNWCWAQIDWHFLRFILTYLWRSLAMHALRLFDYPAGQIIGKEVKHFWFFNFF